MASSHREAPFITTRPKVDGTDFYLFNSYETGRAGYVTMIANYQPFENPQGGPELLHHGSECPLRDHDRQHGHRQGGLTFQFRFTTVDNGLTVKAGTKTIPVPLINLGTRAPAPARPSRTSPRPTP